TGQGVERLRLIHHEIFRRSGHRNVAAAAQEARHRAALRHVLAIVPVDVVGLAGGLHVGPESQYALAEKAHAGDPTRASFARQEAASPQNYGYRTGGLNRRSTVTRKGATVTRTSVREYFSRQRERYQSLRRSERSRLVTEIVAVTGYHRKAVLRSLRAVPRRRAGQRPVGRPRRYGSDVARVAQVRWGAAGQIGAKRRQPFLPALSPRPPPCCEL